MTFTPLIPTSGVLGFRLLERTEETQRQLFERQPQVQREIEYFQENIGNVTSADDLVSDRRLLAVALGAFGLDNQIDSQAFVRKLLEEGTETREAFANRFANPVFTRFVNAFGFGNASGPQVNVEGFAETITDAFAERQFEVAVGDQDLDLRLALNFRREITRYAEASNPELNPNSSDPTRTGFLQALGDRPVRAFLEGLFGLDSSTFGQLDLDRQVEELGRRTSQIFGESSLAAFQDPENIEKAITRYLARQSALNGPDPLTPGSSALTILTNGSSGGGLGSTGIANILLSSTSTSPFG